MKGNLQTLCEKWSNCTRCPLHAIRHKVVFGCGDAHPHLLLIGEGSGKIEDMRGRPFVGPAGQLLTITLDAARHRLHWRNLPKIFMTNVVACRPSDSIGGSNRAPTQEESWACWPRVQEIHRLTKPKVTVFLGKIAERFCSEAFPGLRIHHPSFILRTGGTKSRMWLPYVQEWVDIFRGIQ